MIKYYFLKTLPFFLSIIIIIILLIFNYKLIVNQKSIVNHLEKSNYSQKSYQKITKTFSYYLNDQLIEQLITEEEIKKEIEFFVITFFDQETIIHEQKEKEKKAQALQSTITSYLEENDLIEDEEAVIKLSELLANKYVNTIFPVYELELVEIYYNPINRLINNVLIVMILLLIITLNTLLIFEKKYITKGFIYATIFLFVFNLIIIFNKTFFINQQINDLVQSIKNSFILNNYLIIIFFIIIILGINQIKRRRKK